MRAAISKAEIESEVSSRFADAFKLHEKPLVAAVMPTGIPEVDSLTGGGLPRGAITEIFGLPSSGRTSFLLSTLAHATIHEEVCALIDTNDAFDPVSAAATGVNLDQLLWIRGGAKLEHAFKAADMILQGGGFGLVGLDISDVPAKDARRIISSWWYRFRRTVEKTPTALVVIAADSCVRSCASLTLEMKREAYGWRSSSQVGDSSFGRLSLVNSSQPSTPSHSNLLSSFSFQVRRKKPILLSDQRAPSLTVFGNFR